MKKVPQIILHLKLPIGNEGPHRGWRSPEDLNGCSSIMDSLLRVQLIGNLACFGHFRAVWPDWAIYWTLGKFLLPLATINLPKSPTFLGNFL